MRINFAVTGLAPALWRDLRHGARVLLRRPGFTAVAVLTLALGVGANTAVFSVVNAVLLNPLPYRDPERLVMLYNDEGLPTSPWTISPPDFLDVRRRSQSFESLAGMIGFTAALTGDGAPEQVDLGVVTHNFFPLLGVDAALGRHFTPEEDLPRSHDDLSGPMVVVISHGLWQRRYGGSPDVVGRPVQVNGVAHTVVGVLPAGFELHLPPNAFLLEDADVWRPMQRDFSQGQRSNNFMSAFGRLRPGVTLAQARPELEAISRQMREEHGLRTESALDLRVAQLHRSLVSDARPSLLVLIAAVGLVLLVACANVANLMLARSFARRQEFAVRMALGAGRWRIVRQVLAESLLISVCASAAGLAVAAAGMELLTSLGPASLPRVREAALNGRVLLFCLCVSLLTPLVFGLVPALKASGADPQRALQEEGRTVTAAGGKRLRGLVVVAELALSLMLLVGAGLLVRTFRSLQEVRPGYDPRGVLTFQVYLPFLKYGRHGLDRNAAFFRQLEERIGRLPGVEAVGVTSQVPLTGKSYTAGYAFDAASEQSRSDHVADWVFVSPGYFPALKTTLLEGRHFEARDDAAHPRVVIVDETLARKAWPGRSAVGKRLSVPVPAGGGRLEYQWAEVVGVVEHMRTHSLSADGGEQIYVPYAQTSSVPNMLVAVRGAGEAAGLLKDLEREVHALDKDLPVYNVRLLESVTAGATAPARFSMALMSALGALALLLASVGLYSVISYTAGQRTHEIGIRLAMGAQPRDITKLVVGGGLALAVAGVCAGLFGAFALTRLMRGVLYGVGATDPLTFALAPALLLLLAAAASYLPARRAARVDPMTAIRGMG